jgi:glycosyltransferase involved in cell wall biosynthesis
MRILYVIGSLHVGGAEKQLLMLVRELVKKDIECEVFALNADGPIHGKLILLGVKVHDGEYKSGPGIPWFILQLMKILFRLFVVIRKGNFSIIHTYLPLANFAGIFIGKLASNAVRVSSKRALGRHQERHRLWRNFDTIANRYSDVITVNSMGVWRDVVTREGVDEAKLRLVYNGIDVSVFSCKGADRDGYRKELGLTEQQIAIVVIANLIPYKGHEDAIQALSLLTNKHPDVVMVFAGQDRGIKAQLEQLSYELNIRNKIHFIGRCDNVPRLLCASDIGLIASHEEGFCNALLEEMAASLPVIATDVGGNREALDDGNAGLIVEPHNSESIAKAIKTFTEDMEKAKAVGKIACHRVSNEFTISRMVNEYMEIYSRN